MRRIRITHRTIVLVSLGAFLVLVGVYLGRRVAQVARNLDKVFSAQLQKQLGREAGARRVTVHRGGRIVIENLAVADGPTFRSGYLFDAERVVAHVSLWRLVFSPGDALGAIRRLEVFSPRLFLRRDREGRWNTQIGVREQGAPGFHFGALIEIRDGLVNLEDSFPKGVKVPVRNRFVGVQGTVDGRPAVGYVLNLTARSAYPHLGRVAVEGTYDPDSVVTDVHLLATRGDLGFWTRYLGLLRELQPVAGRADADVRVQAVQGHFEPSWITGTVRAEGVRLSHPALSEPLRDGRVALTFRGRDIAVAGSAALNGVPLTARGTVLAEAPLRLNLTLSSRQANLRRLAQAARHLRLPADVSLPTTGQAVVRVTGTPADPIVTARAELGTLTAGGRTLQGLTLDALYRGGVVQVRSATARALGGAVNLTGQARLLDGRVALRTEGEFRGLRLAELPTEAARGLRGVATGSFRLSGTLPRLSGAVAFRAAGLATPTASVAAVRGAARSRDGRVWTADLSFTGARAAGAAAARGSASLVIRDGGVSGTVSLSGGRAQGYRIQALEARGSYRDGLLLLQRAVASAYGGLVSARGRVSPGGRLQLQVAASDVRLAPLAQLLQLPELQGIGSFAGSAAGTLEAPVVSGRATVRDGSFRDVDFERLSARVVARRGRVSFQDATLRRGDGRLMASGDLLIQPGQPLSGSLSADLSGFSAQEILRLAGREERLPGTLEGQIHVSGSFAQPAVSGSLVLRDTEYQGVRFQEVSASLRRRGDLTQIESLVALGDTFRITGGGELGSDQRLALTLRGDAVPLALLNDALEPYAALRGEGQFTASVVGPLSRPAVTAELQARNLVLNHAPFGTLQASVTYRGGDLRVSDLALLWNGSSVRIPDAAYDAREQRLTASGTLERADLTYLSTVFLGSGYLRTKEAEDLAATLGRIPKPIQGLATGSFSLSGTLPAPALTADLAVTDAALGQTRLGQMQVDLAWSRAEGLSLTPLTLENPQVALVAQGQVHPEKPTQLRVEATRGTVQGLLSFLEGFRFLAGQAAADRLFAAVARIPRPVRGEIRGASLVVTGGQPEMVGSLSFSLANLELAGQPVDSVVGEGDLRGTTLIVRNLHAEGRDMDLVISGSAASDGPLDLVVDANYVSLPLLIPWLGLPEDLSGTANGHLEIRGTAEEPDVTGYLTARDVRVGTASLQSVRVLDIHVAEDQLVLGSVTAVTPQGYTATASGSLPLKTDELGIARDRPIRFHADLEQQQLGILTALWSEVRDAQGAINGSLDVTGTLDEPLFAGALTLQDGTIDFNNLTSGLRDLDLVLTLKGRTAELSQLNGLSTEGGSFRGSGTISFEDLLNPRPDLRLTLDSLQIAGRNVSQRFGEEFFGVLSGQLTLTPGERLPVLAGEVVVSNTTLELPTSPPAPGKAGVPLLPNAGLDVRVTLAQNVRVQRGGANLRGQGELLAAGTLANPSVTGTISHLAGTVSFYGIQRFTIQQGSSVQIHYNQPGMLSVVTLDVRARTSIRAYSPLGDRERYWVTVNLEGPVELSPPAPTPGLPWFATHRSVQGVAVSFESDPPGLDEGQIIAALSRQTEIQALLRGQDVESVFRDQLAEAFTGAIAPQFLEPFETALAEALGLEEFSLVFELSTSPQVQISKRITGPFYLTYRRTITGAIPDYLLKISYRFLPRYQLSWSNDERGVQLLSIEAHQRFDSLFGLRWREGDVPRVVEVPPRRREEASGG